MHLLRHASRRFHGDDHIKGLIDKKKAQIGKQTMDLFLAHSKALKEGRAGHKKERVGPMLQAAIDSNDMEKIERAVTMGKVKAETGEDKQLLEKATEILRGLVDAELKVRTDGLDNKDLSNTWHNLYMLLCTCLRLNFEDLEGYKAALAKAAELELSFDDKMDLEKVELGPEAVEHFQKFFDMTRAESFEEKFGMTKFNVEKVVHVRNEQTRAEYLLMRNTLMHRIDTSGEVPAKVNAKSLDYSLAPALGLSADPCHADYNEFYTFHGTSSEVTDLITDGDFLIKTSADHGWTFGRGVYAGERSTHARFFAQMVGGQGGECAIIVCRVFCGRCQDLGEWEETARPHPKAGEAEENIIQGKYDSTMGAEWCPDHPELREFVLPDDDQILPEFIIYGRSADDDDN